MPNNVLAGDANFIVIRNELSGSIEDAKSSEFIVTGVSVTASGTDDEVLVFTGYISDETIRQQGLLNTFSLGAVGNDVRLHFLIAEGATAYIPTWGDADSALGYNSDGELTNMAFPEELPALGTAGQVLVVNTAENDSEWADAPSGAARARHGWAVADCQQRTG